MSSTRYIITGTNVDPKPEIRSEKPAAIKLATARAEADPTARVVVKTTKGAEVHVIEPTAAIELPETVARKPRKAAKAPAAPRVAVTRFLPEPVESTDEPGWDVIAEITNPGAQILRQEGDKRFLYMLRCNAHGTLHALASLTDQRTVLRQGGWCAKCPKNAPVKATGAARTSGLKAALRPSGIEGFEVVQEFVRSFTEILRSTGEGLPTYHLHCTIHGHTHQLESLIDNRAIRRQGGWCPTCDEHGAGEDE